MEKYLLNLPSELKSQLQALAKTRGFTLNGFILEVIWKYIDSLAEERKSQQTERG